MKGEIGITGPPGSPAAIVGGVTYNKWGKAVDHGVEHVYPGRTGATHYTHGGSKYKR
jgi:hypothetical protein